MVVLNDLTPGMYFSLYIYFVFILNAFAFTLLLFFSFISGGGGGGGGGESLIVLTKLL